METYFIYHKGTGKVIGKYSKKWTELKGYACIFSDYEQALNFLFKEISNRSQVEILESKSLHLIP